MILLGPPGIGNPHLAIGLGVKAARAGYSVLFDTASNWNTRPDGTPGRTPGCRVEEDPPPS
ncbi:ATP-binding protein [Streptomyces sp. NPDC058731]|uniref:ATP-binding protein n=1 Tax=Streptomyces sp. NPDC058731 TaxID=3346613 RepID=UPI003673C1C6